MGMLNDLNLIQKNDFYIENWEQLNLISIVFHNVAGKSNEKCMSSNRYW